MISPWFEERPRKVHLHHDRSGETYRTAGRPREYAHTLCKGNFAGPELRTTTDPRRVTCQSCKKRLLDALLDVHYPMNEEPMPKSSSRAANALQEAFDESCDGCLIEALEKARIEQAEIKQIAKEVGGNADRSPRYLDASAIEYHIKQLRSVVDGTYTHVLPAEDRKP